MADKRRDWNKRKGYRRAWLEKNHEKVLMYRRKERGQPMPTRPPPKLCECCSSPPRGRKKMLSLDHDHQNGRFRGWLCDQCNVAIGALGDTLLGLQRATAYLARAYEEIPE